MRLAVVLAGLLMAAGGAVAQQAQVELAPSEALGCLNPPAAQRGEPEYPLEAFRARRGGRVHVQLTFPDARSGPSVRLLSSDGDPEFVDAVRAHVQILRVPCLPAGAPPAVLAIDYFFRPDDRRVHWFEPVDGDLPERQKQLACLKLGVPPLYPEAAQDIGLQARVLVQLRFVAPDAPPQVKVLMRDIDRVPMEHRQPLRRLAQTVERSAREARLPCLQGAPLDTLVTYIFKLDGVVQQGLKPGLTLPALLPAVKGLRQQRLAFDTTGMACPFDVKLHYRRPHLPNGVAEVGGTDPARRPLLDWLAQADFDLPPALLDGIYGDTALITVPCFKLDSNPDQKE